MAQVDPHWRSRHRVIFSLRRRITWRRFTGEKGRLVGLVIAILSILPIVGMMAVGSWFGYREADGSWPFNILGFVLVGLWLAWISIPLIVAPLSDGIDLERLLIYPLTRRDIVISSILGAFLDYPTYFMLPLFIAALTGLGSTYPLLIPLLLIVLVISFGLMIVTSQLLLTLLGGILQSRRFRDVTIVLVSVSGFGCWFLMQACAQIMERATEFAATDFSNWEPLTVMQWLPPGALARSMQQASLGSWGMTAAWLLYALGWLLLLSWLWGHLLMRLLTGEGFLLNFAPREEKQKVQKERVQRDWGWLDRFIAPETQQIALKEFKAHWRVPQRRILTLQAFIMPIFMGGVNIFSGGNSAELSTSPSHFIGFIFPLYIFFTFWILSQNMIGWEHSGLPSLLLTPVPRQRIFIGKSIAIGLIGGLPLLVISFAATLYVSDPIMLLWCFLSLLMILPTLAVSAITSARFPMPVKLDYKSGRNPFSSGSCLSTLATIFIAPLSFFLLCLPIFAPFLIYAFLPNWQWTILPITLFCIIYAPIIFWWGTRWAGSILLRLEPEIREAARPLEDN